MSALQAAIGTTPFILKDGDQTYKLKNISLEVQTDFETFFYATAVETAKQTRVLMTDQEWDLKREQMMRAKDRGEYALLSPNGFEFWGSMKGFIYFIMLLTDLPAGDAMALINRHHDELKDMVHSLMYNGVPIYRDYYDKRQKDAKKKAEAPVPETTEAAAPSPEVPNAEAA